MNCWDVLQLAPTTDVRAIKKAYAILLKQNRPDENPAGFQRVHAAYQDALNWAEDNEQPEAEGEEANEPVITAHHDTPLAATQNQVNATVFSTAAVSPSPASAESHARDLPLQTEEEQWETFLDQQWDILVHRVEDLLEDPVLRNDSAAWHFLVEAEALLDIDFKGAFAMRFMQRLLQLFKEQQDTHTPLLQPGIVQQLNQLFWWSERRHHYDDYVDPELLDDFMLWWQAPPVNAATAAAIIAPPVKPAIPYGNYYMRWLAMTIDAAGLFALGTLGGLAMTSSRLEPLFGLAAIVLGYPLLSIMFEISPLQATPGKYWCKLKVCDKQGQRMGLFRALLRALVFSVSLYFVYITVIINMLIWDGRLLHDRLTGSMVLKR